MINQDEDWTHVFLERTTGALRDTPVRDGPPPPVVVSTIEALCLLDAPLETVCLGERRRLAFRIARYSGAVAAVMLLAIAAAWFFSIDRSAGMVFAQVLENAKKAESWSYLAGGKINDKPLATFRQYVAGDRLRIQYESGGSNVVDLRQKKGLILDPKRKAALEYPIDEKTAADLKNRMSQLFKLLEGKDARRVGTERVNGHKVVTYQVNVQETAAGLWAYPGAINTVLVDLETKLPVRVEIKWPCGDFILYDEFTWNEQFSPDLFQLRVPQGYTVKTVAERLKEEQERRKEEKEAGGAR
jgi:outer membrane lipoprotein-sorting protein